MQFPGKLNARKRKFPQSGNSSIAENLLNKK